MISNINEKFSFKLQVFYSCTFILLYYPGFIYCFKEGADPYVKESSDLLSQPLMRVTFYLIQYMIGWGGCIFLDMRFQCTWLRYQIYLCLFFLLFPDFWWVDRKIQPIILTLSTLAFSSKLILVHTVNLLL